MRNRLSQKSRVLQYLKDFKTITSIECVYRLSIVDLQKAIQLLRNEGYKITDKWETNGDTHYKRYMLEE